MSKRGGDAALKRAREKARQEKQEAKREKRQVRAEEEVETLSSESADALMEEFARLSSLYEANQVSEQRFNTERVRIFTALGVASDDD